MLKNIHIWIVEYVRRSIIKFIKWPRTGTTHVIFTLVDHFEPKWDKADGAAEDRRVDAWVTQYPEVAKRHTDSDGANPRHTFFYPEEEYEPRHIEKLKTICMKGCGEVEVHLHHDRDTSDGLRKKLELFTTKLKSYGLLSHDSAGVTKYGFIHGNWSLCNSRKDGRWCGVNDELVILRDTGCYADFTLPSAPSDTQTAKINSIYYAKDAPGPKSHNRGIDVAVGKEPSGDLMIIQGPLALNWKRRKYGIFPKIENSGITRKNPPTPDRIDLWVKQRIGIVGRPDWIFIKVHTHGAQDENCEDRFFKLLDAMYSYLESEYNDGSNYKLHYASAREMYNMIKAAESGKDGNPGDYRDCILTSNFKKGNA